MILRVDSDAKVFQGQMHDITVKRGKNEPRRRRTQHVWTNRAIPQHRRCQWTIDS